MSWSPELFIGELRPFPDTVHVVKGKTDEMKRYVPEERIEQLEQLCRDLYATCYSMLVVYDYEERDYLMRNGIEKRMDALGLLEGGEHE